MRRVLIEMRIPKAISDSAVIDYALKQIRLAGFELDVDFAPVPSAPLDEIAEDLANSGDKLFTLRGKLSPENQSALEAQPCVIAVWSDAEVDPF